MEVKSALHFEVRIKFRLFVLCGNGQWRQHRWDIRERTGERKTHDACLPSLLSYFPTFVFRSVAWSRVKVLVVTSDCSS